MLETFAIYVIAAGMLMGLVGYIWLDVRAFQQQRWWGVALLVFPPVALLFIFRHFRASAAPVCVLMLSGMVVAAPYAVNYYERHFVPLKPYEQIVDGELRITLTGLQNF